MKKFHSILCILMLGILAAGFAACSDDDDDDNNDKNSGIVGRWYNTNYYYSDVEWIEFKTRGKVVVKKGRDTHNGVYMLYGEELAVIVDWEDSFGSDETWTWTGEYVGDYIELYDEYNEKNIGVFVKK